MSDTNYSQRVEPVVGQSAGPYEPAIVAPEPTSSMQGTVPAAASTERSGGDSSQLSRIEEKTSRIEEKYARSEALLSRVEDKVAVAMNRTAELASGADLAAVQQSVADMQGRVRRLPGFGALVLTSLLTAALSAGAFVALLRYLPNLLPVR